MLLKLYCWKRKKWPRKSHIKEVLTNILSWLITLSWSVCINESNQLNKTEIQISKKKRGKTFYLFCFISFFTLFILFHNKTTHYFSTFNNLDWSKSQIFFIKINCCQNILLQSLIFIYPKNIFGFANIILHCWFFFFLLNMITIINQISVHWHFYKKCIK